MHFKVKSLFTLLDVPFDSSKHRNCGFKKDWIEIVTRNYTLRLCENHIVDHVIIFQPCTLN